MRQLFSRLGELLALYISLFHVSPWLATVWKDANPIILDVISVVMTAVVCELLIVLAVVRPTIEIAWRDERNPNPLTTIQIDSTSLLSHGSYYQLTVVGKAGSPLGALALERARRAMLTVVVFFPVAPAYPVVDLSRPVSDGEGVARSTPQNNGVEISLTHARGRGSWAWVRILIESASPTFAVTNSSFRISVSRRASTLLGRVCAKVIKVTSSADQLTLYR